MPNFVQVEVTTRCNFKCSYCIGRTYHDQPDMSFDEYVRLINGHIKKYGKIKTILLQGEGESTINRDLFKMASWSKDLGCEVDLITNGSYKHNEDLLIFDSITFSIDTLSEEKANKIGRYNVKRTLDQAIWLKSQGKPITINYVRVYPDEEKSITHLCNEHGFNLKPLNLDTKVEYQVIYDVPAQKDKPFDCVYLKIDVWRFYKVDGTELPCCLMKDASKFTSFEDLRSHLGGQVPIACRGCCNLQ